MLRRPRVSVAPRRLRAPTRPIRVLARLHRIRVGGMLRRPRVSVAPRSRRVPMRLIRVLARLHRIRVGGMLRRPRVSVAPRRLRAARRPIRALATLHRIRALATLHRIRVSVAPRQLRVPRRPIRPTAAPRPIPRAVSLRPPGGGMAGRTPIRSTATRTPPDRRRAPPDLARPTGWTRPGTPDPSPPAGPRPRPGPAHPASPRRIKASTRPGPWALRNPTHRDGRRPRPTRRSRAGPGPATPITGTTRPRPWPARSTRRLKHQVGRRRPPGPMLLAGPGRHKTIVPNKVLARLRP
jgi:hypothetical protein